MTENKEPVFYENLPDGLHCAQACMLMALNSLNHNYTMAQIDDMVSFSPGKPSSVIKDALVMASIIPGTRFVAERIHTESIYYPELISSGIFEQRSLEYEEICQKLSTNFLIAMIYNGRTLANGNPVVHAVLNYNQDPHSRNFVLHDPGPIPLRAVQADPLYFMAFLTSGIFVPKIQSNNQT